MSKDQEILDSITSQEYQWGFESNIDQEIAAIGLSEDTIRFISKKKNEPEWMLDWRLKAFEIWKSMDFQISNAFNLQSNIHSGSFFFFEMKRMVSSERPMAAIS